MLKTKIENILTEVLNEGIEGSLIPNEYAKGKIAVALSQILKLLESVVPEEKEVSKKYFEHNNNLTHEAKEANALNFGFNICRDEIKGKLNE
jgi:hypothetical protein